MSVFWSRKGCLFTGKSQRFIKIRVLFGPEISALGVFLDLDNERLRPLCTSIVWSIYYGANSKCKCWHTALCSVGKVLYTYFCAFLLLNVCIFRKVVFCILRVQSIKHITIHHNSFKRLGVGALFHIVKVWNWRVNHPPPPPFTHTHFYLCFSWKALSRI